MASFGKHKVRERANEGNKVPLIDIDGTDSGDWLVIRSRLSDSFRKAREKALRVVAKAAKISEEAGYVAKDEQELICVAHLIADWSFDEPCTLENRIQFLNDAPHIRDKVDVYAGRDENFFTKASTNSSNGTDAN